MPFYNDLRPEKDFEERDFERVCPEMRPEEKRRCAEGLIKLRKLMAGETWNGKSKVNERRTEKNLIIASWNLLNLGNAGRHGEALYYIAEVISHFDLVALQEIKPELRDLDRIMRILGPNWEYIFNDPARGPGTNNESSAYVFNTDRVRPTGLIGEMAGWSEALAKALTDGTVSEDIDKDKASLVRFVAQRPPLLTEFTTRWKQFSLINVHLEPDDDKQSVWIRRKELESIMAVLDANAKQKWAQQVVVLGDMNLYDKQDKDTITWLNKEKNFLESQALAGAKTNVGQKLGSTKSYDRMYFSKLDYFRFAMREDAEGNLRDQGGVVRFFDAVMQTEDWEDYRGYLEEKRDKSEDREKMRTDDDAAKAYFRDHWRQQQISDHYPIWVELDVDDTEKFLMRNNNDLSV